MKKEVKDGWRVDPQGFCYLKSQGPLARSPVFSVVAKNHGWPRGGLRSTTFSLHCGSSKEACYLAGPLVEEENRVGEIKSLRVVFGFAHAWREL